MLQSQPYEKAQLKCPECGTYFDFKEGKKWCSERCRNVVAGRKYDLKRLTQQSEKAKVWRSDKPEYDRERRRKDREKYQESDDTLIKSMIESMHPLDIRPNGDATLVAGDWHVPFYHTGYRDWLKDVAHETGVKTLCIPGDFLDADAYSKWPRLPGVGSTWQNECQYAGVILDDLSDTFDKIYICRGNHENRVINANNGNIAMKELMEMCHAPECVEWTNDEVIKCHCGDDEWAFVHPGQFWKNTGSLGRAMVSKYLCNIVVCHGHFMAQNKDTSGRFEVLDGGGMFDARGLMYLRRWNTIPWCGNGFYLIDESGFIPYSLGNKAGY